MRRETGFLLAHTFSVWLYPAREAVRKACIYVHLHPSKGRFPPSKRIDMQPSECAFRKRCLQKRACASTGIGKRAYPRGQKRLFSPVRRGSFAPFRARFSVKISRYHYPSAAYRISLAYLRPTPPLARNTRFSARRPNKVSI